MNRDISLYPMKNGVLDNLKLMGHSKQELTPQFFYQYLLFKKEMDRMGMNGL
jgi:hypothetical protein